MTEQEHMKGLSAALILLNREIALAEQGGLRCTMTVQPRRLLGILFGKSHIQYEYLKIDVVRPLKLDLSESGPLVEPLLRS